MIRARKFAMVLALLAMSEAVPGDSPSHPDNRLARESSPYLLQHRHNPVDWYPWGAEALARAKAEDKPIFLSIGYSTCHWCHVMERESFENREIAGLMNSGFVSIKVDREERPDLDNVYMTACQLMTHSGGWPLTVILTPDGRPFFAGTYFPPDDRYGRAGMKTLLPRIAEAWKSNRAEIEQQASHVAEVVEQAIQAPPGGEARPLDSAFADALLGDLRRRFDSSRGGFSESPKFPPHGALQFLLFRCRSRKDPEAERMLRKTLDEMAAGGIFDQVGGGFHRYSVDSEWFVPHFEKMLYDNAQLLEVYSRAAALFGDGSYRETARRTFDWLEREMKTPEGGYASALDADSEGIEGKYYLWTAAEIDSILGPREAPLYREAFGILDSGNTPASFEEGHGKNLPRRSASDAELAKKHGLAADEIARRLSADESALESARSRRVPPSRDDKVLTSWNALAVSALVRASKDLGEPRFLDAARRVAALLLAKHVAGSRVWHVSRGGEAKIGGFLEDYAFLARALLDLSRATEDPGMALRAKSIAAEMVTAFSDPAGGFFQTAVPESPAGKRGLLDSSREFLDQVVPSPNGVAAEVLSRLAKEGGPPEFRAAAERAMAAAAPYARSFPTSATTFAVLAAERPGATGDLPSRIQSGPVRASVATPPGSLRPGDASRLAVEIEIEPGWHIQSRRPSRPDLAATAVRAEGGGIAFGAPAYPSGAETLVAGEKLSTYSGSIEIAIPAEIARDAPSGELRAKVEIDVQACDDRRCLAPARLELGAVFRVAR